MLTFGHFTVSTSAKPEFQSPNVADSFPSSTIPGMTSLSSLLNLYCEQGKWREVLLLYHKLRKQGFQPDTFTFPILLKSSSQLSLLPYGQAIHADSLKRGSGSDAFVANALISTYSICGSFCYVHQLFDEMPEPGQVSWNATISSSFRAGDCNAALDLFERMPRPNYVTWSAMVAGYTQNHRPGDAIRFFKRMKGELECADSYPNSDTIASVLSACSQLRALGLGEQIHGYTIKIGSCAATDAFVGGVLVDMYGKCNCIELARRVFYSMEEKSMVAWSIMISAYLHNNYPSHAIETFRQMIIVGAKPNSVTLTTVIAACADIPDLLLGKELHGFIFRGGLVLDVFVSTALIDMYGKCSCMIYSCRIFKMVDAVHAATWNAIIAAYLRNDCLEDAWLMLRSLCQSPIGSTVKPNTVTLAIILPLCARSASLLYGKEIHGYAVKMGLDEELLVGNGLLDMYSKCGEIQLAKKQFDRMPRKNTISWTSMIDGYGIHGDGEGAIRVFGDMKREKNVEPDNVTFVALISACSHSGLVEEGLGYFKAMTQEYGIVPIEENYSCVVDLLGRAGRLYEAKELIQQMPMPPGPTVWGALLGSCRIHGNVDAAEAAAASLVELDPKDGSFYTLLSNIYAEMGRLDDVAKVRKGMREAKVEKRVGYSWLETKEGIHVFVAGDRYITSHD